MKWWEGKKAWPFISSHAAHAKLDGANGKIRRRWLQIRRIWMDFDAYLRRNGTLMHIQRDLWPHTLTQHWPLTSCILRPTHYIFMIMQIRPHPSLLFITLMNIHDDSATSDVTSLEGCDVTQQRGLLSIFVQVPPLKRHGSHSVLTLWEPCLLLVGTTKCLVTFYLVHITAPNYDRVTIIVKHTLCWNFKSCYKVNQK